MAADGGYAETCKVLLAAGADVNKEDEVSYLKIALIINYS